MYFSVSSVNKICRATWSNSRGQTTWPVVKESCSKYEKCWYWLCWNHNVTLFSSKPSSSNFLSSDRWFILLEEPISQSFLQGIQLAKVKNPKTQDFMHPRILVFFLSSLLQIIWFHGLAILLGCDHGRIHIAHQGDPGFVHRHPSRTSHQNILWLQICVDDATHPVPWLNREI